MKNKFKRFLVFIFEPRMRMKWTDGETSSFEVSAENALYMLDNFKGYDHAFCSSGFLEGMTVR